MDDESTNHDAEREPEAPVAETPAPVRPAAADVFMPLPSTGKEAWRSGSGCGPRARIYLMAVALAGLVAILLVGMSVLRRGVWVTLDQGRQAMVQNLPFDLPPGERLKYQPTEQAKVEQDKQTQKERSDDQPAWPGWR